MGNPEAIDRGVYGDGTVENGVDFGCGAAGAGKLGQFALPSGSLAGLRFNSSHIKRPNSPRFRIKRGIEIAANDRDKACPLKGSS